VSLPQYYTATNTDWVDPVTGAILTVTETQQLVVRDATGAHTLLLFDGSLAMTPQSIQQAVNLDKDGRNKLNLLKVVVPLVAGVLGIAALVTGILLARRRGDQPEEADTEQNEPALA
jgi:hypothetical protein